jgi:hypothetical protein
MDTLFAENLSTRCKNGLTGCFGDPDIIYQPEKIASGRDRLYLARNIGPKSLQEIAELLHKFGFVGNPDKWIGG